MATLKFQFDKDKPVEVVHVEENQPFQISLQKTDIAVGNGMTVKQQGQEITFAHGKKTFKLFIK